MIDNDYAKEFRFHLQTYEQILIFSNVAVIIITGFMNILFLL